MKNLNCNREPLRCFAKQRGLAIFVAMIVLVVMTLAGIAMVRSIGTGVAIAGNIAFRQGAMLAGQKGIEAARTWLLDNVSSLTSDHADQGYYANSQNALDLTGNNTTVRTDDVKWEGTVGASTPKCLTEDSEKYTVCYIIHRLCNVSGAALDSANCSTKTVKRGGSSLGTNRQMGSYQEGAWDEVATLGYYRVTVRTKGPRNTVSYLQAFIIAGS